MEYQNLSFSATRPTNNFNIVGDGFWYVDATAADGVDTRIRITPAGGSAIVLKPGQHFRLEAEANNWVIATMTGAEVFTGNIIIGKGDFGDSNINNTFKLDGTFTNSVNVNNTVAEAVPVRPGTGATFPVSGEVEIKNDAGNPIPISEGAMTYSNSWSSAADSTGNLTIVAPATNVNGVDVKMIEAIAASLPTTIKFALLAKASAPANMTDGDIIDMFVYTQAAGAAGLVNYERIKTIRVSAGKGLYFRASAADTDLTKSVLFTIL